MIKALLKFKTSEFKNNVVFKTLVSESMDHCTGCHKTLDSQYIFVKGKKWHESCFKCHYCHQSLKKFSTSGRFTFVEHEEHFYHTACYGIAFKQNCDVCSQALVGRYYTDIRGNRYCEHHSQSMPRCFSCRRLIAKKITGGGLKLQDGRALCAICHASAVTDPYGAKMALKEAKAFLRNQFNLSVSQLTLNLGDLNTMRLQSAGGKQSAEGRRFICGQTLTVTKKRRGKRVDRYVKNITVLHHLSRLHFISVAVHELGHAWLCANHYWDLEPRVEEGFCTYLEYSYLKFVADKKAHPKSSLHREARFLMKIIENNNDTVYGVGFKMAKKAIEQYGIVATLASLKEKKYWPGTLPILDDLKNFVRLILQR